MIFGLFRKPPHAAEVALLYGAIMAQTRLAAFYLPPYGAPDTFEGRFEILTLHAGLLLRRLGELPAPGPDLAQQLSNAVFANLDDALREIGISDVGVPKKMKKLAAAFMGRGVAYANALQESEAALAEALSRNILAGEGDGIALAHYVRATTALFASTPLEAFLRGELIFPAP